MRFFTNLYKTFKNTVNRLLETLEDPRSLMESAYQRQVETLHNARHHLKEVDASCERLQAQAAYLRYEAREIENRARQYLAQNKEKLALTLLQQKQETQLQLSKLEESIAALQYNRQELVKGISKLAVDLENFRTQRKMLRLNRPTTIERREIKRLISAIMPGINEIHLAVEQIQAQTAGIKQPGVAGNTINIHDRDDEIERELQKVVVDKQARRELAALKKELEHPGNTQC